MATIKTSLQSLQPYTPSNEASTIKLDANEANNNLYHLSNIDITSLNRYPDSNAEQLKTKLAQTLNIKQSQLIIGSGSSELLELVVKTYLNPGEVALSITPSFVMYEKYTLYNNGLFETLPVNQDMTIEIDDLILQANKTNAKIIFLCTPNNPTGQVIKKQDIIKLLENTNAITVVDEAYIEFYNEKESMSPLINRYNNLFITRTFSKAYGLAALRVGYLLSQETNINTLSIVKTPYNVSQLSQNIALHALNNKETMISQVNTIKQNKKALTNALQDKNIQVYPSEANFLLVSTLKPLKKHFLSHNILIRAFPNNLYRITIPNNLEQPYVLDAIKEIK